ncbi:FAD-binding protein [Micromonospora sp. DPT]|uniref:FAD-binding protein n=1 Tax=Micromonospora sp. DPT TaxID=3142975 RepID=UPI00320A5BAF
MDASGVSVAVAPWRNWAGNQRARAAGVARPGSVEEVAAAIRSADQAGRQRALLHRHRSTDDLRLDLSGLAGLVSVDRAERLATVQAGMTLRALNEALAGHGLALPNLGDIDAQTIAGAISTGTHGTGAAYGCLSTFVAGLTLVTGSGEVLRCSALTRPDVFAAAGRLGGHRGGPG